MTPEERAEIEALAADGCCPAVLRYVSALAVSQFQCQRPAHRGSRHEDNGVTWIGPAEPVERQAS